VNGPFYEEGYYRCEIMSQAMTKAKTGTPAFVLRFRVIQSTSGENVPKQYERTCYRYITEKTMPYFQRDLQTLGFNGHSLRQLDPMAADHVSFVGQPVEMRCAHEDDNNGEPRERWDIALQQAASQIEGEPLDSASYRQLDALFGASKKEGGSPRPTPRPRAEQQANMEVTDSDVPF